MSRLAPYDGYVEDGCTYRKDDEIWDLGKWSCVEIYKDGRRDYSGIEDASKLPPYVAYGSVADNPNTGIAYRFTKDGWVAYGG